MNKEIKYQVYPQTCPGYVASATRFATVPVGHREKNNRPIFCIRI